MLQHERRGSSNFPASSLLWITIEAVPAEVKTCTCWAVRHDPSTVRAVRYVVYDPKDPRKGQLIADPTLGQIILGEGITISKALAAAAANAPLASGSVAWDRQQSRVAYRVP